MLERLRGIPVIDVVVSAGEKFARDRASRTAAALAYYTLFSLAPLLFLAVAVAGLVFGDVLDELRGQLLLVLPETTAEFVVGLVADADAGAGLALAAAVALALWSGSALFIQLQAALDDMLGGGKPGEGGIVPFFRRRLAGALGVLGVGVLLLGILAGNAALRAVSRFAPPGPSWLPSLVQLGSPLLSFVVLWATFALVFRFLPGVRLPWRAVRRGAALTAATFLVAAVAVGWFVGRFGAGGAVGAASSVAVLLYVTFLLGQVFLFGAELTAVYGARLGERPLRRERAAS